MNEQLCACGCGRLTTVYEGKHRRFVRGHNTKGMWRQHSDESKTKMSVSQLERFKDPSNHPRWNGGKMIAKGYLWMRMPDHPRANNHGYVKNAVLVLESVLDRPIRDGYDVHHKNENKLDDAPSNLEELLAVEHIRLHIIRRHTRNEFPTKITKDQIEEIRSLRKAGMLQKEIAQRFGICRPYVSILCNQERRLR